MPTQLLSIARNTFVESLRQPICFVVVMLAAFLEFMNVWSGGFSMGYTESGEVSGDNKMLLDVGLATVFVCATVLAAFVATAAVSREIENKTVLTVVSKPVGRATLIVGKYLGVAGALAIAGTCMLIFLLLGIRHGVMTTTADDPDLPVILFGFGALGVAITLGGIANYLYGWSFSQTTTVAMLPLLVLAYLGVLLVSKKWGIQPITKDFKPQIMVACAAVGLSILVLSAVALAASTRLGQVMTIVVCTGTLVLGLLSNHFLGRVAFQNFPVAEVKQVSFDRDEHADFRDPGDACVVELKQMPRRPIAVGSALYYGPNPGGFPMSVGAFPAPAPDAPPPGGDMDRRRPPGVLVAAVDGLKYTIRHVGEQPAPVRAPPRADDFVFLEPTRVNLLAWAGWALIPNMHVYWLVDAVSLNVPVPLSHLALLGGYGLSQIAAFLSLAVVLFQRRDVG